MALRILIVINWFNGGGIDNYVLDYLRHYDRSRYAVDVLCVGTSVGKNASVAASLETKVFHVPKSGILYLYGRRLAHFFQNNRYDIVCVHLNEMSGLVLEAAARNNISNRVAVMHSTRCSSLHRWDQYPVLKDLRNYFIAAQVRRIDRHATAFLSVGRVVKEHFEQLVPLANRLHEVIYLGKVIPEIISLTDPSQAAIRNSLGIPKNALVVGHAGAFKPAKNHIFILECVAQLKHKNLISSPLYILLLGDGEGKAAVCSQAEAMGIADSLIMPGNVQDIEHYYNAMDMLLFPSIYEGVPTALMEVQAVGLAVVASNIAPNLEALAPVWHPYTFPLPDIEQAVQNIIRIINADLSQKKVAAHNFVLQRFGIEKHCRLLGDFFDSLLEQQGGTDSRSPSCGIFLASAAIYEDRKGSGEVDTAAGALQISAKEIGGAS